MRVVALISGGKDSCYNMIQCVQHGHEIVALANLKPEKKDELDSYMFQTVGHHAIDLYAEAMGLPLYRRVISGSSLELGRDYKTNANDEVEDLYELLNSIKADVDYDAISVGAILSDYQRVRVEHVCSRLGISSLTYLWRRDQKELYTEMISSGLVAIIIKVAVMGLSPKKHLGLTMEQLHPTVCKLNSQIGMNVCGEGGEFESFTLDCPLFKKKIVIDESEVVIHSDDAFAEVGYLHFKKMHLEDKPEMQHKTQQELIENIRIKYIGDTINNIPDEDAIAITPVTHIESTKVRDSVTLPSYQESLNHSTDSSLCANNTGGFIWISEITGGQSEEITVEDIARSTMDRLTDKISSLGASLTDVVLMHLFVKNMSDFSKVNSVYKQYFPLNPPARACIEMDLAHETILKLDCLLYVQRTTLGSCHDNQTEDDDPVPVPVREAMHVQSISHWASANIGPYSQVIKVDPFMFVSGNIGLWPATMEVVEGGIAVQAALSLRHVDRIISAFAPQQSILNTMMGYCYVTRSGDIATAREAWAMALNAKRAAIDSAESETNGLMVYLVVPTLPKGALVEWQVTTNNIPSQSWQHYCSSINDSGTRLDFQGVLRRDHPSCGVVNCTVSPSEDSSPSNLTSILSSYAEELLRVLLLNDASPKAILTLRIFYVKSIIKGENRDLWQCVHRTLEKLLGLPSPAFTLLPVEDVQDEGFMLLTCWYQR